MRSSALLKTCRACRLVNAANVVDIFPKDFSCVGSIGFNGPGAGLDHDTCSGAPGGACGCAHAEENACIKLGRGYDPELWLYTTKEPCRRCAQMIVNTRRVSFVVFSEKRSSLHDGLVLLDEAGLEWQKYPEL